MKFEKGFIVGFVHDMKLIPRDEKGAPEYSAGRDKTWNVKITDIGEIQSQLNEYSFFVKIHRGSWERPRYFVVPAEMLTFVGYGTLNNIQLPLKPPNPAPRMIEENKVTPGWFRVVGPARTKNGEWMPSANTAFEYPTQLMAEKAAQMLADRYGAEYFAVVKTLARVGPIPPPPPAPKSEWIRS